MIKYAIITNEETGLCDVAAGTNTAYYESIGMTPLDVEQSDIDNSWYLADKCPHKSEEQKLQEAKEVKYDEANTKARIFLETGEALYPFKQDGHIYHIEATDGNIAKIGLKATSLLIIQDYTTTFPWNTKEDINIQLNALEGKEIAEGLGAIQDNVWTIQFPAYIAEIENAETVEEVEAIVIEYSTGE